MDMMEIERLERNIERLIDRNETLKSAFRSVTDCWHGVHHSSVQPIRECENPMCRSAVRILEDS